MGHTGIVRFPGNLDPRAQEFRPNIPYFHSDFPLIQPQIYYPYPYPYPYPHPHPPREVLPLTPLSEFGAIEYPHQFPAPPAYVRPAVAADPPLPPPSTTPSRTLLLSSVPTDVSESIMRRELEVFGDVRAVQMERVRSGIVTVHFYDLRHAQSALAEIQEQHMQQQCRLRKHFDALYTYNHHSLYHDPINHFLAAPLPPPARGLIAGRAVWAQFIIPVTLGLHEGPNQGTIVIFNLEHDVSATRLKEIFEPFGAIKELRETPLKRHQKFVEFYDVRDAAKALSEMNGKEINGKPMVIEFSRPGGHHKKFSKQTNKLNFPASKYYSTAQTSQPPLTVCLSGVNSSRPQSMTKKLSFGIENPNGRRTNSGGGVKISSVNLKEECHSKNRSFSSKKNSKASNSSSTSSSSSKGGGRQWKGSRAAKEYDPRFLINEDAIIESNSRDTRTTVMIKNIPNKYSQKLLLNMLDNHCIHCNEQIAADGNDDQPLSSFDFVYLPIDFINKCNVGYGFVNMTSPEATLRLYKAFHHQSWEVFNSRKICEVTYARLQGIEALKEHFKNSKFPCETGDYLPVLFSPPRDGRLLTDPTPIVARPSPPLLLPAGGGNITNDDESQQSSS